MTKDNSRTMKARYTAKCSLCGGPIHAGEPYQRRYAGHRLDRHLVIKKCCRCVPGLQVPAGNGRENDRSGGGRDAR